ncbi:ATPase with chaperone activity ATP-binding subunit domain protein, partial [Yersinia pestis PY-46]
MRLNSCWL